MAKNTYDPNNAAHQAIAKKIVEKRDRLTSSEKSKLADALNAGKLAQVQEILKGK